MFGLETEVLCRREVEWLEPVLTQWLRTNRDYLEEYDCEDALYSYNERASIGTLAGAIWKCNGLALEEYSATKGKGDDKSRGRVDLYFHYAGKEVVAEAKMDWIYLLNDKKKDYSDTFVESISKAGKDLERTIHNNEADYGMALSFFSTHSPPGVDVSKATDDFRNAVKKVFKAEGCDFYAWFRNTSGTPVTSERYQYDIAVLMGKVKKL